MTVPFNFATQSGNIPLSELDANFANVSASTLTATYVTGNNQSNITDVGTLNSLSAYGNVTAGNVSTNGIVRANAVIGVNYTGTNVSVTGNITGGNISATNHTGTTVSVSGNVTSGNVLTGNLTVNCIYSDDSTYVTVNDGLEVFGNLISEALDVTGNAVINNLTVTGNFIGTDITVNSIKNGSSNVDITNTNGNVTIGVDGINNVLVVTSSGAIVSGTIETTDLVVSNVSSDGSTAITVSDDLSVHGDIDVTGDISATGTVQAPDVVVGNISSDGSTAITVLDNLSVHGDIDVIGDISATGLVGGYISATGNIRGGNIIIPNGKRVYGDFSSSVANGRTVFQTLFSDGPTNFTAIPTGANNSAAVVAYNSSDESNYGFIALTTTAANVTLRSGSVGNVPYIPLLIETGNVTRVTVDINGNVGIGNTAPVDTLSVGGNAYVSGAVKTTPTALANLTAVAGARAFINNANLVAAGNFGALVGSGGANLVPVWSNGSNWYIG